MTEEQLIKAQGLVVRRGTLSELAASSKKPRSFIVCEIVEHGGREAKVEVIGFPAAIIEEWARSQIAEINASLRTMGVSV